MATLFEWDEDKAAANLRKHGIGFDLAARAFADPFALTEQDRIEGGEYRWRLIGMIGVTLVVVVAHTWREEADGDVVRIISARPATAQERRRYAEDR